MPDLSPPEHLADRRDRKRIVAQVVQAGGCGACLNRIEAWGRTICSGHAGRAFPLCLKDQAKPAFELDEETLR